MIEKNVDLPLDPDWGTIEACVEGCIVEMGLRTALKGTLKSFPGSIHWHFKRGVDSGTLEITLWPDRKRLWCSVQSGRPAKWIDDMLPALVQMLASRIAKRKK